MTALQPVVHSTVSNNFQPSGPFPIGGLQGINPNAIFSSILRSDAVRDFERGIRKNNPGKHVVVKYHLFELRPALPGGRYLFKITSQGNKTGFAFVYGTFVVSDTYHLSPEYELGGNKAYQLREEQKTICCPGGRYYHHKKQA